MDLKFTSLFFFNFQAEMMDAMVQSCVCSDDPAG